SSLYRFFIASSKFIIHQEDFQHFSWSLIRGLGHSYIRDRLQFSYVELMLIQEIKIFFNSVSQSLILLYLA
ncbi:hypothetical protein QMM85_03305, partial [Leptospira santarosai]|nr:hypothetical protein [Leptospira santarosai]